MSVTEINIYLFRMINDLGKEYIYLNPIFVFIAEYMVYFLGLFVIIYLFTRNNKNRLMIICAGLTLIIAEIAGKLAGKLHSNSQPFAELLNVNKLIEKAVNNSFPSDHTIIFFSFCVTFWLFKRGYAFLWIVLAILAGISRIWVGVHYPADVAVGAIISIFAALIVYLVVPRLSLAKRLLDVNGKNERSLLPTKAKSKDL